MNKNKINEFLEEFFLKKIARADEGIMSFDETLEPHQKVRELNGDCVDVYRYTLKFNVIAEISPDLKDDQRGMVIHLIMNELYGDFYREALPLLYNLKSEIYKDYFNNSRAISCIEDVENLIRKYKP